MTGEHEGVYYPLTGMSKDVQQQLIDDHFLFKAIKIFYFHNKNLISRKETDFSKLPMPAGTGPQAAGSSTTRARRSWCGAGRRTTSGSSACRRGGHVGQVFGRLKEGVEKIQDRIPFSSDPRLGMLTFCPTNLGTTIRARQVSSVS